MAVRGMNIMSAMHKQAVCSIDSSLALPRMGLCLELMNIKVNERRKIAAEVFNIYVFTCACVRACVRAALGFAFLCLIWLRTYVKLWW